MPDIGSAIGGATSLIGGAMSSDASSSAADAQAAAGAAAIAEQRRQYDLNRSDLAPWRNSGSAALSKLDMLLGITPTADPSASTAKPATNSTSTTTSTNTGSADVQFGENAISPIGGQGTVVMLPAGAGQLKSVTIPAGGRIPAAAIFVGGSNPVNMNTGQQSSTTTTTAPGASTTPNPAQDPQYGSLLKDFTKEDFLAGQDPSYQFRMDEGQKALERGAAARGGALSGRAVKEAERYGQNLASEEYGAAFNRYNTNRQTKYNFLSGQAGTGQSAVNTGVAAGSNSANSISDLMTQVGNVNAAGIVGGANSWSTGLGKVGNFFGSSGSGSFSPSNWSSANGMSYPQYVNELNAAAYY